MPFWNSDENLDDEVINLDRNDRQHKLSVLLPPVRSRPLVRVAPLPDHAEEEDEIIIIMERTHKVKKQKMSKKDTPLLLEHKVISHNLHPYSSYPPCPSWIYPATECSWPADV